MLAFPACRAEEKKAVDYVQHPELFAPVWGDKYTARPDMLDWEEKKAAFNDPDGRVLLVAHRGDNNLYYPENSLEGALSVIAAGADIIETDIHLTKDGVPVLMHDDTLERTTDWKEHVGKNGLPESSAVCDWTYEELLNLRLKSTEYRIPTLEQLICVCKNRVFITLDKINQFDWEKDILPLIVKHEAYETVLIPYTYSVERAHGIQQQMLEKYGAAPFYFADARNDEKQALSIEQLRAAGMPVNLRDGEVVGFLSEDLASFLQEANGKYKIYIEVLRSEHDKKRFWDIILQRGYGYLMGNLIYAQLDYWKEIYPDYTDRSTWNIPD